MTIEEAIKKSKSMREAANKAGIPFTTFKRKASSLGLYDPNQGGKGTKKPYGGYRITLDEIFKGKHPQMKGSKVRAKIVKEEALPYKCSWCGISEWSGKELTLQLDHINGNSTDHRKENLRFLCPNCHTQTETW